MVGTEAHRVVEPLLGIAGMNASFREKDVEKAPQEMIDTDHGTPDPRQVASDVDLLTTKRRTAERVPGE